MCSKWGRRGFCWVYLAGTPDLTFQQQETSKLRPED